MTSVHPWDDSRIFRKMCRWLASAGHEVHLVAANGPAEARTEVDGVRLHLLPTRGGRLRRMTETSWAVFKKALRLQGDVTQFHDPELLPYGMLMAAMGRRVIYDAHEDAPRDVLIRDYLPRPVRWAASAGISLTEWTGSRFFYNGIVTATPLIGKRFPKHKTRVVHNYAALNSNECDLLAGYKDRPPHFAFVGAMSWGRGTEEMVRAIGKVKANKARLVLAGPRVFFGREESGPEHLPGWEKVLERGVVSAPEVTEIYRSVRAGLILFLPGPNHDDALPNKLFEYMAAGLPLIVSDIPMWRLLVEEARCGLLLDPNDVDAVARALDWVLEHPAEAEDMGRRGARMARERYNWASEARRLELLYREVTD